MERTNKLCRETKYFNLYEVGQGIYAAIENNSKKAGSNAGFVDMGSYTIVFDTLLNLDGTADLRKAAEELTGKPVKYLINSHFHLDHTLGNSIFDESTIIISSEIIRNTILEENRKAFDELKGVGAQALLEIEESLKHETDPAELNELNNDYKFISNVVRPEAVLRAPELCFQRSMKLFGGKREAELTAFEKSHSPEDVILYLPEHKVCFAGDLLFSKSHPWIGTGIPENYIKALESLLELEAEVYIPGHGGISSKEDVRLQIQYIKEILALAAQAVEAGNTDKMFTLEDISEVFRGWNSLCFSWNMDFLMKRHKNLG